MSEKIILRYSQIDIKLTGTCENCVLREELNDGMNITDRCLFDEKWVDKFQSKCHLTEEDKKDIDGKKLIKTVYIE